MNSGDDRNLGDIKQRIEKYWNGRADQYDLQFGHGIFSDDETKAWLNALDINLHQPRGSKVLDAGCGTGFLSLLFAELGFSVIGLDFSDEMMAEAVKKASSRKMDISFLRGDAESPGLPPCSFCAVVSRHLLWTLPDPEKALFNWKNLLAPGGQIIVIDGIWRPRNPSAKVLSLLASAVMRVKGKKKDKSWEKDYMKKPSDLPFMGGAEPDEVCRLFEKVGLIKVHVDNLAGVIQSEKKIAPLEHRLRYTLGKTRYLISGQKASNG